MTADPCPTCAGTGILMDQTYGYADVPNGWRFVQACDACERFKGDGDAAQEVVTSGAAVEARWFDGAGGGDDDATPGDWAVRMAEVVA